MNLKTIIGQLRLLTILEGISYISFGITMPLKYTYGIKEPNFIMGSIHGGLFVLFMLWSFLSFRKGILSFREFFLMSVSSIIPFMSFWADRKLLRNKR